MGAVGLQTYIWNNNIKSTLLLLGFPLLLLAMVYAFVLLLMGFGYLPSDVSPGALMLQFAPMAIGAAALWFVIAYFSYQSIIDLSTGAHPVSRQELPRVYNLLENLAISRGMKTPTLRLIETDAMNAFATGLHGGPAALGNVGVHRAPLARLGLMAYILRQIARNAPWFWASSSSSSSSSSA